jgi:Domain of unknown function (DUF5710)
MPRVDLQVPFQEKDEAKQLGARWDGAKRVWYVPDGMDATAFKKWLPEQPEPNIKATYYYIAETKNICWKCSQVTRVFGLLLPPDHEEFEEDEWERRNYRTLIHFVTYIPDAVQARMAGFTKHYRVDFSKTADGSYWMNHCEHCGAKQGDFPMYNEPEGAFFPIDERAAALISLHRVDEPIAAKCDSLSIDVSFFEDMRKAS